MFITENYLFKLKDMMNDLGVIDYWIVFHEHILHTISYDKKNVEYEHKYINNCSLFFEYEDKIGNIILNDIDVNVLKKLLIFYMNNSFYYSRKCKYTIFDKKKDYNKKEDFIIDINDLKNQVVKYSKENDDMIEVYFVNDTFYLFYNEISHRYIKNKCGCNIFNEKYGLIHEDNITNLNEFFRCKHEKQETCLDNIDYFDIKKYKTIKLSRKVFQLILEIFIKTLDGSMVVSGNSLFKKEDIGSKVLKNSISIINKNYNNDLFDLEGVIKKDKVLIKNGVLVELLNDIKSAAILGLQPGNVSYDEITKKNIIKSDYIYFFLNENENENMFSYDIYIDEIIDSKILLDLDSGNIIIHCLAKNAVNKIIKTCIDINLIYFINCIKKTCGDLEEINGCFLPEVIVGLEE